MKVTPHSNDISKNQPVSVLNRQILPWRQYFLEMSLSKAEWLAFTDDIAKLTMDPKNIITPGLYLIPTPIGNLADMTLRAIDVLKQLNVLYCEDTRTSGVLLKSYDIRIPKLSILNDHNESQKVTEITDLIKSGQTVGIMSDAGTPLMNDPGFKVVRGAIEADVSVISLPGASSVTTALVA